MFTKIPPWDTELISHIDSERVTSGDQLNKRRQSDRDREGGKK